MMDRTYPRPMGSEEWHTGLHVLLAASRRAAAAYLAAEPEVTDHRLQAALKQLRRGHERHVDELASILEEIGGAEPGAGEGGGEADAAEASSLEVAAGESAGVGVARDGGEAQDPLGALLAEGRVGGREVLDAVRRIELELRDTYAWYAETAHVEPIRAMLNRHRREEEAHVAWLYESPFWRDEHGEEGHRDF